MNKVTVEVYEFDELPEHVQERICESAKLSLHKYAATLEAFVRCSTYYIDGSPFKG